MIPLNAICRCGAILADHDGEGCPPGDDRGSGTFHWDNGKVRE